MRGLSVQRHAFGVALLSLVALPVFAQSTQPSSEAHPPGTTAPVATGHPDQTNPTSETASTIPPYCGLLRGYSANKSELQLAELTADAPTAKGRQACQQVRGDAVEIQVQGQALKDGMTNWKAGDLIIATVAVSKSGATELTTLQDIQPQVLQVAWWEPGVALFSFPLLVILLAIFSKSVRELLFIGQDGRWSNSQTQMSLWFTLWVSAYVGTFILRWTSAQHFLRWTSAQHFLGSITTPSALLTLSGLSGLTFAGAKGITANKAANPPAAPAGAVVPNGKRNNTKAAATSPADLLKDDNGNFDFGDFQMLVVTLIAVISYSIIAYHFLGVLEARASVSLPDVDGTVLAMFGVGQGAYLAKKASTGIDQ